MGGDQRVDPVEHLVAPYRGRFGRVEPRQHGEVVGHSGAQGVQAGADGRGPLPGHRDRLVGRAVDPGRPRGRDEVRGPQRPGGGQQRAQRLDQRRHLEQGDLAVHPGGVLDRQRDVRARLVPCDDDAEDPVVQVGHRRLACRTQGPEQVDGLEFEVELGDVAPARLPVERIGPGDPDRHVGLRRQQAGQPVVDRGFGLRPRAVAAEPGGTGVRRQARGELDGEPVGQGDAAARGPHDGGLRREALLGVGVQGRGGALGIAEQHLVGALGDGEVGQRVVDVQQVPQLGVDRLLLVGGGRRHVRGTEWVGGRGRRAGGAADEFEPVDDVAGLDHVDVRPALRCHLGQLARAQRERAPQRREEAVELDAGVLVVQPALEPPTEQRPERVARAQPVEQFQGDPDPPGAQIHRERARGGLRPVGEVAGAQHGGGGGVAR